MIKMKIRALAELCHVSDKEAFLYLLLSAAGWAYFVHQYLYSTGLGIAVPKYASY